MLTILIIAAILCVFASFILVAMATNWVIREIHGSVKEIFHLRKVEAACNKNTEKRLAEVLKEYKILHLKAEALSEEKDRIARITQAVARGVKHQQAEAAQQISYLMCENENLKEEVEGRWLTIDFLRETVMELKNIVEGQDSTILSLQEKTSRFCGIILELHEELDTMHNHANMPDDQEAASLEAAANKLRRAQLREEKAFLRSAKQARQEANRKNKG